MFQEVSHWPLTVETRISSEGQYMWDLWWTKRQWDVIFFQVLRFSSVSIIPRMLHVHSSITDATQT
jgi:hypothetical protein